MRTDRSTGGTIARGLGEEHQVRWPLRRSSELFELRYGKALVASSRRPGIVPVFGTNGQTGTHDEALFRGPGVIIGRKGAGHLGVHWSEDDFWVIDTAYSLMPRTGLDLKFAYYLVSHVGLDHLKNGTSNPSLTREAFGAQYFPVPPIETQRAIAATLGALDDKIESNRRAIQLLRQLAITTLIRAGDTLHVVGQVADVRKGISYNGAGLTDASSGMPMVNMGNAAKHGWLKREGLKFYRGDHKSHHIAPAGSLIVTGVEQTWRHDIIGWPLLVPSDFGDVLFTHHMFLVDFLPGHEWMRLPLWAHLYTPTARARLESLVHGTTVATLPPSALSDLTFLSPPQGSPSVTAADAMIRRAWHLELQSNQLAALRDVLLPEVLSGRVRLQDPRSTND